MDQITEFFTSEYGCEISVVDDTMIITYDDDDLKETLGDDFLRVTQAQVNQNTILTITRETVDSVADFISNLFPKIYPGPGIRQTKLGEYLGKLSREGGFDICWYDTESDDGCIRPNIDSLQGID